MAERVGFEPTNELPRCWFSRPVLSTAQPPLLGKVLYEYLKIISIKIKLRNINYSIRFKFFKK